MSLTEPLDEPGSPGRARQPSPIAVASRPPRSGGRGRGCCPVETWTSSTSPTPACSSRARRVPASARRHVRIQGSRAKLEGRIVRSKISTIHRDGTLSYESAIEFDTPTSVQDIVDSPAAAQAGGRGRSGRVCDRHRQ